jgi:hypothetical protein
MLYLPLTGPVVVGCGVTTVQEFNGAATLLEEINVNNPASAFQERIILLPDKVAVTDGRMTVVDAAGFEITV